MRICYWIITLQPFAGLPDFHVLVCILCAIKTRRNKSLSRLSHEQTPLDIGLLPDASEDLVRFLVNVSFEATKNKRKRQKNIWTVKGWIAPSLFVIFYASKLSLSSKNSLTPIITYPFSSRRGFILFSTTTIFLKESMVLSKDAVSCSYLAWSGIAYADWI